MECDFWQTLKMLQLKNVFIQKKVDLGKNFKTMRYACYRYFTSHFLFSPRFLLIFHFFHVFHIFIVILIIYLQFTRFPRIIEILSSASLYFEKKTNLVQNFTLLFSCFLYSCFSLPRRQFRDLLELFLSHAYHSSKLYFVINVMVAKAIQTVS